jgi:ABC-type Fe3+/spermidine/putrescine transport system ATPase subunit
MAFLEWRNVRRTYGSTHAVRDLSLEVPKGEVLALLGPSGSGKSTLLRLTAGLEEPSEGAILLDGRDLAGTAPHTRRFGLMFQEYCLFPHLDVGQNVEFGLRMRRAGSAEREAKVAEMLALVRLPGFARRSVISLSGGEQQRVALARSLAPDPRLLMLDEPLGALDSTLRASLLEDLPEILKRVGVTTIYVTHDQAEAMTIASRVALIRDGCIVQAGTPADLVSRPKNAFAAAFLGLGALLPGAWNREENRCVFVTELGTLAMPSEDTRGPGNAYTPADAPVTTDTGTQPSMLLVRADALHPSARRGLHEVRARVVSRLIRPAGTVFKVALMGKNETEYPLELSSAEQWRPGERIALWLDPERCQVLQA